MTRDDSSGWGEYRQLVLRKLDDIEDTASKIDERVRLMEQQIVLLQVKSSLWGGIAGLGTFAATWLIQYLSRKP